MLLLPLAVSAQKAVEIDGIYYKLVSQTKEATVTRNPNNYTGSVDIPASITYDEETYTVTSIGGGAFQHCIGLTSVTIPNSVTSIGVEAFIECSGLTAVTIGNGVTKIEKFSFIGCSSLTSVTIPYSVTSIGEGAFHECSGLTEVSIPSSVTSIGEGAFGNCSRVTTIWISSGVKEIGSYAFAGCPKLIDVYCLAETAPSTGTDVFLGSNINYATLHLPWSTGELPLHGYNQEPWSYFGKKVLLDNLRCATPTIAFVNGELVFSCETEGVEYWSEVTITETGKHQGNNVKIGGTYKVSVYATKIGLGDSDVATLIITLDPNGNVCDVNGDGFVDVADISTILSNMAGY